MADELQGKLQGLDIWEPVALPCEGTPWKVLEGLADATSSPALGLVEYSRLADPDEVARWATSTR